MKRNLLIGSLVCCLLAAGVLAMFSKGRAATAQDAELLPGVVQGCKDAVSGTTSGKGNVGVHSTFYSYDGDSRKTVETDGTYNLVFDGPRYKIAGDTRYLKNESVSTEHPILPGQKLAVNLACDGQNLMDYQARIRGGTVGPLTSPDMQGKQNSLLVKSILLVTPDGLGHGVQRIDLLPPPSTKEIDKGLTLDRRESLGGRECLVVQRTTEAEADGVKVTTIREYWVDTERGFTVPRVREWGEGGPLTAKAITFEANTEFRDYGQGHWGPAKYTYEQNQLDGKGGMRPSYQFETTYEPGFQLNVPISPDDLKIKLPPDARMQVLDDQGNPSQ